MAVSKKKKGLFAVITLLAAIAFYFYKNPNTKAWKAQNGTKIDMSQYPLSWSIFSSKVTVQGRTDIQGVLTGNTLSWSNGSVWTY